MVWTNNDPVLLETLYWRLKIFCFSSLNLCWPLVYCQPIAFSSISISWEIRPQKVPTVCPTCMKQNQKYVHIAPRSFNCKLCQNWVTVPASPVYRSVLIMVFMFSCYTEALHYCRWAIVYSMANVVLQMIIPAWKLLSNFILMEEAILLASILTSLCCFWLTL